MAALTRRTAVVLVSQIRPESANSITVSIFGEASVSPTSFSTTAYDISSRTRTTTSVQWAIPVPNAIHELVPTPDISPIVSDHLDGGLDDEQHDQHYV